MRGTARPLVSAIICTYNRADSLRVVLEDMLVQETSGIAWELVVVDNNSNDRTREAVEAIISRASFPARYLFEPRQGKSFALNSGVSATQGEILAFTDDDMRVDSGWVRAIAMAFARGDCDLAGGRIRAVWPSARPDWYVTSGRYKLMPTNGELDLGGQIVAMNSSPFGGNMAVRRALIEKHGGFRTDLGPKGRELGRHEDTEFGTRLITAGARCLFIPDAIVDHLIQEKHTTKSYVQQWYFNYGRSSIQESGTAIFPRIFGIPRFLFRKACGYLIQWLLAINPRRCFYYRLQTHLTWGSIVQAHRMRETERQNVLRSN